MGQFRFVRRGHEHETGQAAEIGDVVGAGVGGTIGADQPGAVERKANRKALDRNVMHHLVIGTL